MKVIAASFFGLENDNVSGGGTSKSAFPYARNKYMCARARLARHNSTGALQYRRTRPLILMVVPRAKIERLLWNSNSKCFSTASNCKVRLRVAKLSLSRRRSKSGCNTFSFFWLSREKLRTATDSSMLAVSTEIWNTDSIADLYGADACFSPPQFAHMSLNQNEPCVFRIFTFDLVYVSVRGSEMGSNIFYKSVSDKYIQLEFQHTLTVHAVRRSPNQYKLIPCLQ